MTLSKMNKAVLLFLFPIFFVYSSENLGLQAHFSFDGNANDSTQFGYHGLVKNAKLTDGKFGESYEFDGKNDYIAIQKSSYSSPGKINQLTLCAWINTSVSNESLFSNWSILDFDRSEYFNFFISGDNGKLGFSTTSSSKDTHDLYGKNFS